MIWQDMPSFVGLGGHVGTGQIWPSLESSALYHPKFIMLNLLGSEAGSYQHPTRMTFKPNLFHRDTFPSHLTSIVSRVDPTKKGPITVC